MMNFLLIFVERAFAEVCWNHYTTKLRILKRDFCRIAGAILLLSGTKGTLTKKLPIKIK